MTLLRSPRSPRRGVVAALLLGSLAIAILVAARVYGTSGWGSAGGSGPSAAGTPVAGGAGGAGAGRSATGAQPISLAAYQARLDRAIRLLAAGPGDPAERLAAAEAVLAEARAVKLPGGEVVELDPLLAAPREDDPAPVDETTLAQALARLQLVRSQIAAAAHDDTAARRAILAAILARPEFQARGWWDRLGEWFRFNIPDFGAGPVTAGALWAALALAVGLAAIALVGVFSLWLRRFFGSVVPDADLDRAAAGDAPTNPAAARARAAALAEAGDYREAVRLLYLAAVLRLDERGLLRYDRSQTNHEHLAQVAARPAVATHLEPMVAVFDSVWYGVHVPDASTFERYRAEVLRLDAIAEAARAGGTAAEGTAR